MSSQVNNESSQSLAGYFESLCQKAMHTESMTIQEILEHFGSKSHLVFIVLLSIPFNQPIPLLGLSTPLGLAMAFVAIFYMLNRPPKMPRKISKLKVPRKTLVNICEVATRVCRKIEKLIKPRWLVKNSTHTMRRVLVGGMIVICSLLLCLPLPIPFTNAVPSIATTLLSIAELESDGVLLSVGVLAFIGTIVFFGFIFLAPIYGIHLFTTK